MGVNSSRLDGLHLDGLVGPAGRDQHRFGEVQLERQPEGPLGEVEGASAAASAGAGPSRPIDAPGEQHRLHQRLVVVEHEPGRHEHDPPASQAVQGAHRLPRRRQPDGEHDRPGDPLLGGQRGAVPRPAPATVASQASGIGPEHERGGARAAADAPRRRRTTR